MTFFAKDTIFTKTDTPQKFNSLAELEPNSPTDHMVEIDWSAEQGWSAPQFKPFAALSIDPTSSCLHYATQCFEGLKAYRSNDGKSLRLIRPILNCERLLASMERICLPKFDPNELLEMIKKLVAVDGRFIEPGKFIYVRPYAIGTNKGLGVQPPSAAKLGIVMTMMPSFAARGALKLAASKAGQVRAWPGGIGASKLGANYGPTMLQGAGAAAKGYDLVLWLFGDNEVVTEAGAANFFVVWVTKEGVVEVVTCSLELGLILPGINRRTAIEYLQCKYGEVGTVRVVEKELHLAEIVEAKQQGRLREAFAIGTAVFVTPVEEILLPDESRLEIPIPKDGIAEELKKVFKELRFDDYQKPNDWVVEVEDNEMLE